MLHRDLNAQTVSEFREDETESTPSKHAGYSAEWQ